MGEYHDKRGTIFILDTSAFRNLFETKISINESVLLKLSNICELFIPAGVRDEIWEDIKKGEFACSEEDQEEIRVILENTRIRFCQEAEKICYNLLKRTDPRIQRLEMADRQCISLALQLSRHKEYSTRGIYVITDDYKMFNIAEGIFRRQFTGHMIFPLHFLVYLSVRKIINLSSSELVNILKDMLRKYKRAERREELARLLKDLEYTICPFNCAHHQNCPLLKH